MVRNEEIQEEFNLFSEIWRTYKQLRPVASRHDAAYWDEVAKRIAGIMRRHSGKLAKDLSLAILDDLERRCMEMKIRTQDYNRYLEYGEVYAEPCGDTGKAAVYVINLFHPEAVCIGVYSDMARARGVLCEMDWSYQARERVFYAPSE